jgi:hypothetical protein
MRKQRLLFRPVGINRSASTKKEATPANLIRIGTPGHRPALKSAAGSTSSLGEVGRASEYFTTAFQLREHASEREKLAITAHYYSDVTGELDKAAQTYQEMIESYPRQFAAYVNFGERVRRTGAV